MNKPYTLEKFSYGTAHNNTVEDARRFQPPINQTSENNLFIKDMLSVLERFPHISLSAEQPFMKTNKYSKYDQVRKKERNKKKENEFNNPKEKHTQNILDSGQVYKENYNTPKDVKSSLHSQKKANKYGLYCNKISENREQMEVSENLKLKYIKMMNLLSKIDESNLAVTLMDNKKQFLELLPQIDCVPEVIPQVVEVLKKIFHSESMQQLDILSHFLDHEFVQKLLNYITLLPSNYDDIISESHIVTFFENVFLCCKRVNILIPLKSKGTLRKILMSIQYSIKGLQDCQDIEIDSKCIRDITDLLNSCEGNIKESVNVMKRKYNNDESNQSMEPPNDIRTINIFPSKGDIFEASSYIRENITSGPYKSVEHYLDVQFRLLHEDFISPFRNGILEYSKRLADNNYNKNEHFDNIKIYENVKMMHGIIMNNSFGHLVQLNERINRCSNRFIFGSLVIFTNGNFSNLFCATVVNQIDDNLLVVNICNSLELSLDDIYGCNFTMIESEIYFEPYYQALKGLQQMAENINNFPMKKYIVDVESQSTLSVCSQDYNTPRCLNLAQEIAFKAAMSDEFVVIQGPPGTGKTFLALHITKALLDCYVPYLFDYRFSESTYDCRFDDILMTLVEEVDHYVVNNKPILVISYTNHALDQFLVGLLNNTTNLVRIGGQSKNEKLQKFNLKEIRKQQIWHEQYAINKCGCYTCDEKKKNLINIFHIRMKLNILCLHTLRNSKY